MKIGDRFGYLKIESLSFEKTRYPSGRLKIKIPCVCDCGNKLLVTKTDLQSGHTKSCGCYRKSFKKIERGASGFKEIYRNYKRMALKRRLTFNLSEEQFKTFTKNNCFYCGDEPKYIKIIENKDHSKYLYNGIDRINNNLGYTLDNCVSCCKKCNISKHTYSQEEFFNWIKKTYQHLKEQNKL